MPFDKEDPIRAFGTSDFGDELLALMADTSVRSIPYDTAPESLRALFTRAAGDKFDETAKRTTPLPSPNLDEFTLVHKLKGSTSSDFAVAFSPDGSLAAAVADDGNLNLWEVATGTRLLRQQTGLQLRRVAFSPDGKLLVTGGQKVILWDVAARKKLRELPLEGKYSLRIQFTPDGAHCYAGVKEGECHVWNVATGKVVQTLKGGAINHHPVSDTFFVSPHQAVEQIGLDGRVMRTYTAGVNLAHTMQFSDDGRQMANGTADGPVLLWELESGKMRRFDGHQDYSVAGAFIDGDTKLVTWGRDKTIRLWDVASARELQRWTFDAKVDFEVTELARLPDGRHVALGCAEDTLLIIDARTGQTVRKLHLPGDRARRGSISPDGRLLLSAGGWTEDDKGNFRRTEDTDVYLWRLPESVWPEPAVSSDDPFVDKLLNDALAVYTFAEADFYRKDGRMRVRDVSGHGQDASIEDDKKAYAAAGRVGGGLACNRSIAGFAPKGLPGSGIKVRGQNMYELPMPKLRLPEPFLLGREEYTVTVWVRDTAKGTMPSGKSLRVFFQEGFAG